MARSRTTLAVVAVVAGALLGVPSASAVGGADSAVRAAAQTQGRQVFVLLSTDVSDAGESIVIGRGPIHAKGEGIILGPRRDRLVFPDGNLVIFHEPGGGNESFDPVTCYFHFVERGTWRVVRGTGAYADAEGHGRYVVRGDGVGCSETEPLELFSSKVRAVGSLSY